MQDPLIGQSKIERLRRGLYSRKTPDLLDTTASELKKGQANVAKEWSTQAGGKFDALATKFANRIEKTKSYTNRILLFSAAFFAVSVVAAFFVFFGGLNMISSRNVDIKVVGPVSVPGGQEIELEVLVVNGNSTSLESAIMNIEYPEGVMVVSDGRDKIPEKIVNQKFELGTIKPGDRKSIGVKAFVYGEKDEVKQMKINVEYKVKNSGATFYKEKIHDLSISSSPLILTPTYPKEVNSNQDISFSVEVASNSKEIMESFLVMVEYPFGFTYKGSNAVPIRGNNTWLIEGLKPNEKRTIDISGNIVGQDNEERVFNVEAGTPSEEDNRTITTVLSASKESIFIKKAFLGLKLELGGTNGDFVYQRGDVNGNITIVNNLPERVFNTTVEARFSGSAFDPNTVRGSQGGFFRSLDKTIFWDSRAVEKFKGLEPGDSVALNLSFSPLGYLEVPRGTAPDLQVEVITKGERILESGAPEKVESREVKKIKFATNTSLTQKVVRSIGKLENSGPIPPKVDRETTYTISWSLTNTWNAASNIQVKAVLPPYVKWAGRIDPASESVVYNQENNEIAWNVNQLLSGTGFSSSAREVMFQVILTPSLSQVGMEPIILGRAALKATDKATGATIENSAPEVTTKFSTDPAYRMGDEKVSQ
jgi:hypothetical protein